MPKRSAKKAKQAFWERGYLSHGYWLGKERLGTVELGPKKEWDGDLPLAGGQPLRRDGDAGGGEACRRAGRADRSEPATLVRQELVAAVIFGVLQREPLHALLPEVDLQPRVGPRPFRVDDHALTELRVLHRLADAEAVAGALLLEGLLGCRRPRLVVEAPRPATDPMTGVRRFTTSWGFRR